MANTQNSYPVNVDCRSEVVDLIAVLRDVLADSDVWGLVRDLSPGSAGSLIPQATRLYTRLAELGLLGLRRLEVAEGGLSIAELVPVFEVLGEVLVPESIAGTVVLGSLLQRSPGPGSHALAEELAEGSRKIAFHPRGEDAMPVSGRGRATASAVVASLSPPDIVAFANGEHLTLVSPGRGDLVLDATDPTRALYEVRASEAGATLRLPLDDVAAQTAANEVTVLLAAETVGAAASACARTVSYVRDRHQFGRAVGSFQAVKHQLADVWSDIEMARAAVQLAATTLDLGRRGDTARRDVAVAAATSVMALQRAAESAIHLHGGMGVAWESGMHLFLRRALVMQRLLGDARGHQQTILQTQHLSRFGGAA